MTSLSILKMEAIRSSETSVNFYQTYTASHSRRRYSFNNKHVCKVTHDLLKQKKTWSLNYTNNTVIFTVLIIFLVRLLIFLSNLMKTTFPESYYTVSVCTMLHKNRETIYMYREFKPTATLVSTFIQKRTKEDFRKWIYKGWIKSSGNSSIVLKWLYYLR